MRNNKHLNPAKLSSAKSLHCEVFFLKGNAGQISISSKSTTESSLRSFAGRRISRTVNFGTISHKIDSAAMQLLFESFLELVSSSALCFCVICRVWLNRKLGKACFDILYNETHFHRECLICNKKSWNDKISGNKTIICRKSETIPKQICFASNTYTLKLTKACAKALGAFSGMENSLIEFV